MRTYKVRVLITAWMCVKGFDKSCVFDKIRSSHKDGFVKTIKMLKSMGMQHNLKHTYAEMCEVFRHIVGVSSKTDFAQTIIDSFIRYHLYLNKTGNALDVSDEENWYFTHDCLCQTYKFNPENSRTDMIFESFLVTQV
jgi:hypothetical protein